MKNYQQILLSVFSFSLLLLLAACGPSVSSQANTQQTVTINKSFQSQRTPIPTVPPYRCGAWSSNNAPGAFSTVNIYARLTRDIAPVSGAAATAVAAVAPAATAVAAAVTVPIPGAVAAVAIAAIAAAVVALAPAPVRRFLFAQLLVPSARTPRTASAADRARFPLRCRSLQPRCFRQRSSSKSGWRRHRA